MSHNPFVPEFSMFAVAFPKHSSRSRVNFHVSNEFPLLRKVSSLSILSSCEFKIFYLAKLLVQTINFCFIKSDLVWIHWALHLSRIYPLLHFLGISCFSGTVSTNLHYFWTVCPDFSFYVQCFQGIYFSAFSGRVSFPTKILKFVCFSRPQERN